MLRTLITSHAPMILGGSRFSYGKSNTNQAPLVLRAVLSYFICFAFGVPGEARGRWTFPCKEIIFIKLMVCSCLGVLARCHRSFRYSQYHAEVGGVPDWGFCWLILFLGVIVLAFFHGICYGFKAFHAIELHMIALVISILWKIKAHAPLRYASFIKI